MIYVNQDFKTIQIALSFIDVDDPKKAVYRFLLPKILSSQTDSIPTKIAMHTYLETLYGAYFRTKAERIGQYHVTTLTLTMVDPKMVDDALLLKEAIKLFYDVLYDHQSFDQKLFEEEKRLLIEQWDGLYDKKRHYANHKFNELFYEHDHEGYPISGTKDDIIALTADDLFSYYQNVFLKNEIIGVVSGRLTDDEKNIINMQLKLSTLKNRSSVLLSMQAQKEPMFIEEKTVMNQAMIKLGYILPIFRYDHDYPHAVLIDTILGGYPESKLFKEIREKEGLCYDIASNYHPYKGTLTIGLGVDPKKRVRALKEIDTLILDVVTHGFTEEELSYAKSYVIHQLKMSLDNQSVLTKRALLNILFDETYDIEARISAFESVRLEEINRVVKTLKLNTTYILYGGEHENNL